MELTKKETIDIIGMEINDLATIYELLEEAIDEAGSDADSSWIRLKDTFYKALE